MIRKSNVALAAGLILVTGCALLARHSWSTYNDNLKVKLQVSNDEITKLEKEIKVLKADAMAKDEKINELESQPK